MMFTFNLFDLRYWSLKYSAHLIIQEKNSLNSIKPIYLETCFSAITDMIII